MYCIEAIIRAAERKKQKIQEYVKKKKKKDIEAVGTFLFHLRHDAGQDVLQIRQLYRSARHGEAAQVEEVRRQEVWSASLLDSESGR